MGATIINHQEPKAAGSPYDLLWENANPASQFAAQTIALPLGGYSAVRVAYTPSVSSTHSGIWTAELPVGSDTVVNGCYYYFTERGVTVAEDGVTFGEGRRYEGNYGSSTLSSYPSACVPLKVWGVR